MSYTFRKTVSQSFPEAIDLVTQALGERGFGVLTTIDVQATMQKKLGETIRPYTILGACNPKFAFQALGHEPLIGAMLPCNVIVRERNDGTIEVAAVDPVASMQAVENPELGKVAMQVREMLKQTIDAL